MNDHSFASSAIDHGAALQRIVDFFETLTPQSARETLAQLYAADASFKDPFNHVHGLPAILPLFTHMFEQVENPRFQIIDTVLQHDTAFITWDFLFHMRRYAKDEQCIHGATQFRFNSEGLVTMHRDYWDAAEELYEKLPVVGGFMRLLKHIARK